MKPEDGRLEPHDVDAALSAELQALMGQMCAHLPEGTEAIVTFIRPIQHGASPQMTATLSTLDTHRAMRIMAKIIVAAAKEDAELLMAHLKGHVQ